MERNWQKIALENKKKYAQFINKANKQKVFKQLDALHEAAFKNTDCLSCAACCKNYSPRFKTPDIKRISKYLKLKESTFIDTYLQIDQEGDYVLKTTPCAFLMPDNYCAIYDVRPSDCSRFPYTNEDVLLKRKNITLKNVEFCPAVFYVMEKLVSTK